MQQATNAQREPSMEEILASIRRIIEDSDAARTKSEGDVDPAREAMRVELAPAPERPKAPVIDVDAFRAELRGKLEPAPEPKAAAPVAPPVAETPKPKTLAEVQAEIMRGSRRPEPVAPVAAAPVVAPPVEKPVAVEVERAPEPAFARPAAATPAPAAPPPARIEPVVEIARQSVDDEYQSYEPEPRSVATRDMKPEPVSDSPRPSILSERTGRQVAAAFGELSEAFAESRKKGFDETAEQMLRPMLQEWLDNNLPTLVERLVREEIERVARGG